MWPTTIGSVIIGAIYLSSFTFLNDQLFAARQHLMQQGNIRYLLCHARLCHIASKNRARSADTSRKSFLLSVHIILQNSASKCTLWRRKRLLRNRYSHSLVSGTSAPTSRNNSGSSSRSDFQVQQRQSSTEASIRSEAECSPSEIGQALPPRLLTDFLAAVLASMSTALIEGPMDVFQNRVQVKFFVKLRCVNCLSSIWCRLTVMFSRVRAASC